MRPDSPGPAVFGSSAFVPNAPPSPKATRTSAIQPKVAVFQWSALQRPMRAARLVGGVPDISNASFAIRECRASDARRQTP